MWRNSMAENDTLTWVELADGTNEWGREFWLGGPPKGWKNISPGATAWKDLIFRWISGEIEDDRFFSTLRKYKKWAADGELVSENNGE